MTEHDGTQDDGTPDGAFDGSFELSADDDAFVTRMLATLPPLTMPADVVARIDAALAAAAADGAADPESADGTGSTDSTDGAAVGTAVSTTVVPLDERRTARNARRARVLQVAAGVAVLAVVGLGVAKVVGGSSPGDSTASIGGAGSPSASVEMSAMSHSGHVYTDATLVSDVRALADKRSPLPTADATASDLLPSPASGGSDGSASARLFTSAEALGPCLTAVEEGLTPPVRPVALDQGVWKGRVALVVVLPGSPDPAAGWDVFVVGTGCGQGGNADLLIYRLVPKG